MKLFNGVYAYVWGTALMDSSNTYIVLDETSIVIDPGCFKTFVNLFGLMKNDGIEISDMDIVFNTHLHKDHCESNHLFLKKGALLALNSLEYGSKPDIDISKMRYLNSGRLNLEFIHTPGHTPGSTSIYIDEFSATITGDLIFENGLPGRIDFGSNTREMVRSLEKIQNLDSSFLLPGHGRILEGKEGIRLLIEKAIQIITRRGDE
jgi:glyoxylase-like metal-dependent hydrolase (beta-lactamase superfamily II)